MLVSVLELANYVMLSLFYSEQLFFERAKQPQQ